jgi:hypothetical protein
MTPRLVVVLGMHRSGTSATTGMLQEYGLELGEVNEQDKHNARGNREIPELNQLHNRILERNSGAWWDPPKNVSFEDSDRAERDAILDAIEGDSIGIKDPRMLLVLPLWRDLSPLRIGVIRNPVAVRESLQKRSTSSGKKSPLNRKGWERLWVAYNRKLIEEHDRDPFPIINFDVTSELDEQVRASLRHYGIEPQGQTDFFERELLHGGTEWRSDVRVREAVELYDELAGRALAPPPAANDDDPSPSWLGRALGALRRR